MPLPNDFVERLKFLHPREIAALLQSDDRPKGGIQWTLKNEVRPADLYCYLGARFGQPNGFQNFLRQDDSSNLIHWEWFLACGDGHISIMGMNFRTEIWITGMGPLEDSDRLELISQLKADFSVHGQEIGKVRRALEHWIEFVNPYQRLRRAVVQLHTELSELGLSIEDDKIPDVKNQESSSAFTELWNEQARKYSRAIGLYFGIRSMLPVMAEAFVNLLLYMLLKPEIKSDERLRENTFRQPIDVRVKSLSLNCRGFKTPVDYSAEPCKKYHTLVNERNDLLHGNVAIDKLQFNELYFFGKVPIFLEYSSMWERSLGVAHRSVGLSEVDNELAIIDGFIDYLKNSLEPGIRENVEMISNKFDLGLCLDDGRLGILFSDYMVDFGAFFPHQNKGKGSA